eukprot:1568922-Rhodomonas_salina.1
MGDAVVVRERRGRFATKRVDASCLRCQHSLSEMPRMSDWMEHWVFIRNEIDELVGYIQRLDERLNRLTHEKRAFQK